jgi:hypothetical protein
MLQDIVDRSNTSYLRAGNPDIAPTYLHTTEIQYINTNKKAGTTFSISVSYTGSNNYFCDSLIINNSSERLEFTSNGEKISLKEGDQFTKPINLGGYHKMSFKSAFAMPIDPIRCNFNIGLQTSIQRLPSMINGEFTPINRNWFQLSGRLDSNISRNILISYTKSFPPSETTNHSPGVSSSKSRNERQLSSQRVGIFPVCPADGNSNSGKADSLYALQGVSINGNSGTNLPLSGCLHHPPFL